MHVIKFLYSGLSTSAVIGICSTMSSSQTFYNQEKAAANLNMRENTEWKHTDGKHIRSGNTRDLNILSRIALVLTDWILSMGHTTTPSKQER